MSNSGADNSTVKNSGPVTQHRRQSRWTSLFAPFWTVDSLLFASTSKEIFNQRDFVKRDEVFADSVAWITENSRPTDRRRSKIA